MIKICMKCNQEFETLKNGSSRRYCFNCVPQGLNTGAKLRQLIKQWAVEYKGGKCEKCGYHNFISALEFHHLNPKEKDFCLSDRNLQLNWNTIQQELDKCVLICANCHRAEHELLNQQNNNISLSTKRVSNAKQVRCINTNEVFGSTRIAAEWCGLQGGAHISQSCDGYRDYAGTHPVTAEKLKWEWVNSEDKNNASLKPIDPPHKYNESYQVQCHTGEIFANITEAATWCGLKGKTSIAACCNGRQKTAGTHPVTKERLVWKKIYKGEKNE